MADAPRVLATSGHRYSARKTAVSHHSSFTVSSDSKKCNGGGEASHEANKPHRLPPWLALLLSPEIPIDLGGNIACQRPYSPSKSSLERPRNDIRNAFLARSPLSTADNSGLVDFHAGNSMTMLGAGSDCDNAVARLPSSARLLGDSCGRVAVSLPTRSKTPIIRQDSPGSALASSSNTHNRQDSHTDELCCGLIGAQASGQIDPSIIPRQSPQAPLKTSFQATRPAPPSDLRRQQKANERAAILGADPLLSRVERSRVYCRLCEKWIQLRKDCHYSLRPWIAHKDTRHVNAPEIPKPMNGISSQPQPKRPLGDRVGFQRQCEGFIEPNSPPSTNRGEPYLLPWIPNSAPGRFIKRESSGEETLQATIACQVAKRPRIETSFHPPDIMSSSQFGAFNPASCIRYPVLSPLPGEGQELLQPHVQGGFAEPDTLLGRKKFVGYAIQHLFGTTYGPSDDLPIYSLLLYLNAAMPMNKYRKYEASEVWKFASTFAEEGARFTLEGDIIRGHSIMYTFLCISGRLRYLLLWSLRSDEQPSSGHAFMSESDGFLRGREVNNNFVVASGPLLFKLCLNTLPYVSYIRPYTSLFDGCRVGAIQKFAAAEAG
ncbi:hypothetical protein NMY22_g7513 [Coprinellus aureogranulatus]|nr:hypothetical protein NMY22_g7513 [Coprinellus aureogranulatus]